MLTIHLINYLAVNLLLTALITDTDCYVGSFTLILLLTYQSATILFKNE